MITWMVYIYNVTYIFVYYLSFYVIKSCCLFYDDHDIYNISYFVMIMILILTISYELCSELKIQLWYIFPL
jgi:hypothetical protein